MERMELSNPREVIKRLLQESKLSGGSNEFDPLAYFEQHVDWDEVNLLLYFCRGNQMLMVYAQVPFFDTAPNIESWVPGSLVRFRCMVQVKILDTVTCFF